MTRIELQFQVEGSILFEIYYKLPNEMAQNSLSVVLKGYFLVLWVQNIKILYDLITLIVNVLVTKSC